MLKRKRSRPTLNSLDRLFWTTLRTFWSRRTGVLVIVQPETVIAWHRGFSSPLPLAFPAAGRPVEDHR